MAKQGVRLQVLELLGYTGVVFLFLFFNLYLATKISTVQCELTIETEKSGNFQLYWRQDNRPYEEKNSVVIKTDSDQSTYSFKITSFANFNWLRIDPVNTNHAVQIRKLSLSHDLYQTVTVFPQENEISLTRVNELEIVQQSKENGIYLVPMGDDPHFEISVSSSMKKMVLYSFVLFNFAGAFLFSILLNQTLLKGSRKSATVLMIIPKNDKSCSQAHLLKIVRKYCPRSQLVSIQAQPESDKYIFDFPILKSSTLTVFLKEVKNMSHLIQCRVHYNRSGEV